MLEYLHVKNLALIREAELLLSGGLNIISGETGAGKSVLLGSVNLALGGRADKSLIRTNAPYALVELRFCTKEPEVLEGLRALGIETGDGEVIISRKILPDRSFARLNGEMVSASLLSRVSELLINIHGQHDHQKLLREEMHLSVLDEYGREELKQVRDAYGEAYRLYREKKEELKALGSGDDEERRARMDFLEYEIREIEDAELKPDEEEALKASFRKLSNAKKIRDSLLKMDGLLSGNTADCISQAVREALTLKDYSPELNNISETAENIETLITDLVRDVRSLSLENDADEQELYRLESRIDLLNSLKRKYGGSIPEILRNLEKLRQEYETLERFGENKARYEAELKVVRNALVHAGRTLHEEREKVAARFSREMVKALSELNFLSVRFEAVTELTTHYSKDGADDVRFMISTNPGEELKPLSRVASGGELSRVMLAVRTLISDSDHVETLIFDEIDTGISGKTGAMVAEKLRRISERHQVICISHLPQIVSMADHHYLIEKNAVDGETVTSITPLDEDDSIRALAGLLGGGEVTDTSIQNAKEMRTRLKNREK